MENDFVVLLNDLPIKCNKKFIQSNFPYLFSSAKSSSNLSTIENQRSIQLDRGNDFFEVTSDIFQGNDYDITSDNYEYLKELSNKINSRSLQTKLNSFCYKRECDDHQIDQHPYIGFLIEISTLIHQLSETNYENISSQIRQKLNPPILNSIPNKDKSKKQKKKKGKGSQKKKQELSEEEDGNEETKEEKTICLKNVNKKSLSKLFYYEIVNNLSSQFHTLEELQEHKDKINLVIQLIKELDSDDDEDGDESDTYIDNFINYVIEKYSKIKTEESAISNHHQETFYLINYLISNELLTIEKLHYKNEKQESSAVVQKILYPEYFLHLFPQKMIDRYFKIHSELLDEDNAQSNESNYNKRRKSMNNRQQKSEAREEKIKKYLQNHQQKIEEGFSFDDDLIKIIINDDFKEFKSYLRKKVSDKIKYNKSKRIREKVNENMIIDAYTFPLELSSVSCISALNRASIIELSAFFGSKRIFEYLNAKYAKHEITNSSKLISYIIAGQDTQIIKLFLDSLNTQKPVEIENDDDNNNSDDNYDEYNYDDDDDDFDDYHRNHANSSIKQDGENDNAFNNFNEFYYPSNNNENPKTNKIELNTKTIINNIKEMMNLCIEFCKYDLYSFLHDCLLQYKDQEMICNIDYNQLDNYMEECVSRSYFEFIPDLLKEGSRVEVLLNLFCSTNNEIGIEYMLEFSYIDINAPYRNQTPLEYCINNKNGQTSLLLLKNDKIELQKEENSGEETLLHTSCRYGLSKVVEHLLHNNLFDINVKTSEGIRPIHLACKSGDFETVQTIIQEKKSQIKINGKVTKGQYKGFTPLHFACLSGNPQIVDLLLTYGHKVDINLIDGTKKWTPLQYAVLEGHFEVVSILLDQEGIQTDMKTKEDETLLHLACMSNKEEIVDLLLNSKKIDTKFDLNARTLNKRTPLQIALSHGNCNMISVLLNIDNSPNKKSRKKGGNKKQSDIDPNIETNNGQAPLIFACEMRRIDIFNLLLKHDEININITLSTGKTALYVACELNIIEIVKELLSYENIDVNAATKMGKTPLIVACEKGNKEIVELLIKFNDENSSKKGRKSSIKTNLVDFNAKTTDGKSALLVSCEYLRMDIAEMLVSIDEIECDDASDDGKTPLCYACEKSSEYLVSQLINHGADVNHHTNDDRTPLYFACSSRNMIITQNILMKIDDNNQINLVEKTNGTSPLFIACQNGDLDIFALLINEIGDDVDLSYKDNNGKTLLFAACEGENAEIVEKLLTKYEIDSNLADNEGKTPLHVACEKKNREIVFLLLNHSTNQISINEKWNDLTPLEIACEKGSIEIVQLLLQQEGIQVNPTDKNEVPPLLCACEIWRTDIIKLLLNEVEGIDVDVAQSDGRTALHYACEKGDVEISEIILSRSTESIGKRTTDKKTPIELACQNENVEIISLLLKHVTDIQINAKFFDGNTILSKACIQQSVDVVKLLLEDTVIDVNAINNNEKSALFIVAKNGNEQLCQMLLDHEKIDINMEINQKTPLYEACKYGNAGVVELLIKKGAKANCLTKNGKTPLHVACQHGFNNVVSLLLNCPEVDVNLLTVASPEQIQNKYYKTFYSPLHLACLNKNNYSHRIRPIKRPQWASNYSRFNNNFNNQNDDFDYNFNRTRLALGNKQLCVELLIHHPQIDINLQTSKNETALTIACQGQKFDIIKILLQSPQIDPNVSGSYNNTALHIACQNSKIDLVQMLLNNPKTNVNCENVNDQTPLSISCDNNRVDIVKLLLNREDLRVCKTSQENPIRRAIRNNNIELFTILLHHPSFNVNAYDKNSVTPLGYAIESQNINFILKLLLISGINVNKKLNISKLNLSGNSRNNNWRYNRFNNNNNQQQLILSTPLNIALKINNYKIVKMLIQSPELDVNEYASGKTALIDSIISEKNNIASLLLSSSNIDTNLITQLDEDSITLLIRYEVDNQKNDPYLFGQNALHIAIQKHNLDVVKELIMHEDLLINEYTNADDLSILDRLKTKLYNVYKTNALAQQAARRAGGMNFGYMRQNDIEDIKDTELSVKFENQYRNGCNALYIACSENQAEIVSQLLLRSDIDLNAKSTNEELTPLHIAAKKGYLDIVNILLSDDRCDANAISLDGTNILTFACQSNNIELLTMILERSGDSLLYSTTSNGDTPLHCAAQSNNYKIFEILLNEAMKSSSFDINLRNKNGETPLHFASKFNVPDSLYKVPKNKFKKQNYGDDDDNDNDYNFIDDYKIKTVFGILLENGADVNASNLFGQTPLHFACINQCYNNIDILFKDPKIEIEGIDQEKVNSTPFITLISSAINLYYKVDDEMPDIRSSGSMIRRFNYHHTERINRCQVNVPKGLIKTICKFLDRGVNYQQINEDGISLLHFAIICRSKKLVDFFLKNVNTNDIKSFLNYHCKYGSPIKIAIDNWNNEVMPLLLQKKKEIEFSGEIKNEIIYKCALNNDEQSMLYLLLRTKEEENDENLDFNVNYIDKDKGTPLHVAVYNQNSIISNILANYSQTDTNILDKDGKSALHRSCMTYGNSESTALSILTKVELKDIQRMFKNDKQFNTDTFNKYLKSQLKSNLNDRIDINLQTKGMTRREYFRIEREKELKRNPNIQRFHIYYHEPEFNIGFTALHISVSNQLVNVVSKILQYPDLLINTYSIHGDTAVSIAAKNWNESIVRMLLDYPEADLNFVPKEEESDDEYDDYGNHKEKNDDDSDSNQNQNRPPHTLTSEEIYEIKEKKRNQNKTLLHAACENNSIDIVKRLIKMAEDRIFDINGVDSFDGMAPLHYICQNGNIELLNIFIDFEKKHPNEIDWNIQNKNGMTPLHFAVRSRQTKIVDILLNNEFVCPHIDVNCIATGEFENGRTPISFACEKGDLEIVNLLLSDKNKENKDDFMFESNKNASSKKIKRGSLCGARSDCDLSIKSKAAHQKGMTALHYACKGSNLDLVKLLLNHGGFDINIRANGKSCLFLACQHKRVDIVKLLLDQKDINYNIKTPRGVTPLMIASQEGSPEIVEMLLNLRKIDKNALTADGQSAKDMAKNSTISDLFDKYA